MNESRLAVDTASRVEEDSVETPDLEVTEAEVRNLLYGMENLRKQKGEEGEGEAEAPEADGSEQ